MTAPTTPTRHTASGADQAAISAINDDIQYLLYLETLKRFKDDETNISKQVEEKTRQYQELKAEYLQLYTKYAALVKLAATRAAIEADNCMAASQATRAKQNIALVKAKTTDRNLTEYINPELLQKCKEHLRSSKAHTKLSELQCDLVELKTTVRAIQLAIETVENTVETATMQGLDYFVDEFQADSTFGSTE